MQPAKTNDDHLFEKKKKKKSNEAQSVNINSDNIL